jgi:hypothetical protein
MNLSQLFCEKVNNVLDRLRFFRIISHTTKTSQVLCLFEKLLGVSRVVANRNFLRTYPDPQIAPPVGIVGLLTVLML